MRDTLADGARNVGVLLVLRRGVRFSIRAEADKGSLWDMSKAVKAVPSWVRLVRKGNTFTGHLSEDGQTWQPVGRPATVEMGRKIFAGLAVTSGSRDESRLHTSTFDEVAVRPLAR